MYGAVVPPLNGNGGLPATSRSAGGVGNSGVAGGCGSGGGGVPYPVGGVGRAGSCTHPCRPMAGTPPCGLLKYWYGPGAAVVRVGSPSSCKSARADVLSYWAVADGAPGGTRSNTFIGLISCGPTPDPEA